MANHVNTYIQISGLTSETVGVLKERLEGIGFGESVGAFFPNVEYTHEFFFENIGSKWCTLEDLHIGEDYVGINLTSAWSYPNVLVEKLNELILETQKEFKIKTTYEDECPNFFGAEAYVDGECEGSMEWDDEDVDDLLCDANEEYAEAFSVYSEDEDDEDAYEKMCDLKNDFIWEVISDAQYGFLCEF
jgi:hypothetical protein